MAIDPLPHENNGNSDVAPLSAKIININLTKTLKPKPKLEDMIFGEVKTDHMLIVTYEPTTGWSIPEIKPYGPLSIDPSSSCLQYCPNTFEGMKAYRGPDGKVRLFRPDLNMRRLTRSAERVALPPFDTDALLELIKRLVDIESEWVPDAPEYSLYIRPTIIGTRDSLGVGASDTALLYVFLSPTGPYFLGEVKGISLLAVGKTVRAWPGGTGDYKLGLNYAPTFLPQRIAAKQGYDQVLWLFGEESRVTEAGAMNFFAVLKRDDGDLDVITPTLDGTILPGVTRASCLALLEAHTSQKTELPNIPPTQRLHPHERIMTMHDLNSWSAEGKLVEAFVVGTGVIITPVGRIGFEGKDLVLPLTGLGPVSQALRERIGDIQTGKTQWNGWSVVLK